jgi:hypothetical protein
LLRFVNDLDHYESINVARPLVWVR